MNLKVNVVSLRLINLLDQLSFIIMQHGKDLELI